MSEQQNVGDTSPAGPRIERVITQGVLGAGRPGYPAGGVAIENNVWLLGDDQSVWVIDAAHDAAAIAHAVGDREPLGILLTHGHEDHVNAARDLAQRLDAQLFLHPDDVFLWEETHGAASPDVELADGARFQLGETMITTLHTPGHTPGSVCFAVPQLDVVFSGDTLFQGGPGATRWEYSSFPTIVTSISERLFSLPERTAALPGHGAHTTIGAEQPALREWLERGW